MVTPTYEEAVAYFGGLVNTHRALTQAYMGITGKLPEGWEWDNLLARFCPQQLVQTYLLERIAMDLEELIDKLEAGNAALQSIADRH